jgi:hypothetical protein
MRGLGSNRVKEFESPRSKRKEGGDGPNHGQVLLHSGSNHGPV